MGTDIHGAFQRHDGNKWVDVESSYEFDRHYQLFAVLAGVRNGHGFAGVVTGEVVTPISEPRGLPADFVMMDDLHPDPAGNASHEDGPLVWEGVWMGDHSHSWLTSAEMLAWYDHAPIVVKQGLLTRAEYDEWDKVSKPAMYCGDAWGPGVVKIHEAEIAHATKDWSHVFCTWESPLRDELAYFFDEVRRLHELHSGVRLVFGFDS